MADTVYKRYFPLLDLQLLLPLPLPHSVGADDNEGAREGPSVGVALGIIESEGAMEGTSEQ